MPLVLMALHEMIASSALKFLIKLEANSPTMDKLLCFNTPGHRKHFKSCAFESSFAILIPLVMIVILCLNLSKGAN